MPSLIELLKEKGMGPYDLARILKVNPGQIYQWDKKGIHENSKYYPRIKEILPDLIPKPPSKRVGWQKEKELHLIDTDFKLSNKPPIKYSGKEYPRVIFKKK